MTYKANATVTSKGQVTVPVDIREKMGIKAGDRLTFDLSNAGKLTITPVKQRSIFEDFEEVRLPSFGRALSRQDVADASRAAVAKKFGGRSKPR